MERITYKHYIDTPVLDMYVIFDCYEPDDAIDAKCMFIQLFDTETPGDSTENIVFPYSTQTLVQYFSETVSGIVAIVLIQSSELRSSTSRLIVVLWLFFSFGNSYICLSSHPSHSSRQFCCYCWWWW